MRGSVYRQLCTLLAVALISFGLLVGFLWSTVENRAASERYQKVSAVLQLLLAPKNAPASEQQSALERVTEAAGIQLLLLDSHGQKIAETGTTHARLPLDELEPNVWTEVRSEQQWATRLADGRFVSVVPEGLPVIDETLGIFLSVLVLVLLVGGVTYPFVRRITKRIELLQEEVVRIGRGALGARVHVDGSDEIAELAQSFNHAAERIEELVSSQRMLLAHVSHELRTPLARIRMGIELLDTKPRDGRRIAAIGADIHELDELIRELLVMSRLTVEPDPRTLELIDVVGLVAEEVARYPTCELTASAPDFVLGDPATFRRVVRNLIDNAFTHGAEPVKVSVISSDVVTVAVSDAGEGFADDGQIWLPFRRTAASSGRPGYGLGLALVQRAAKSMGGRVDTQRDERFSVSVSIPKA